MNQTLHERARNALCDRSLSALRPDIVDLIHCLYQEIGLHETASDIYRADWEWRVERDPDWPSAVVLVVECTRNYKLIVLRSVIQGGWMLTWGDVAVVIAAIDQQFHRHLLNELRRTDK